MLVLTFVSATKPFRVRIRLSRRTQVAAAAAGGAAVSVDGARPDLEPAGVVCVMLQCSFRRVCASSSSFDIQ
jgi:hypothetical protein